MGIFQGACGGVEMKKKEPNISIYEWSGDKYMDRGHYRAAEDRYRQALKAIGKKTWKNRKDWKRVWNKLMTAMHLESERVEVEK
jgi:hypothetical protein